ncbi:hypothetical protein N6B72_04975 [Chryseobacterium soli]|uniref:hypothetical protein n=1 Tax=Chryseobacterium soli TaxID=445961 RepID=UPI00295426AA|nr:hypothetical protein [Chryseobacterium soli]MDV7696270.1 hypothetical protein [Chryseobacterium soli]
MDTLISMTEFVLQQNPKAKSLDDVLKVLATSMQQCHRYATFLKQPLTLGMFVPTDEAGNVLKYHGLYESYKNANFGYTGDNETQRQCNDAKKYFEAKERVLFYGFKFIRDNSYNTILIYETESSIKVELQFRKSEKDIRLIINDDLIYDCNEAEKLIGLKTKPTLTSTAKKQINGKN